MQSYWSGWLLWQRVKAFLGWFVSCLTFYGAAAGGSDENRREADKPEGRALATRGENHAVKGI